MNFKKTNVLGCADMFLLIDENGFDMIGQYMTKDEVAIAIDDAVKGGDTYLGYEQLDGQIIPEPTNKLTYKQIAYLNQMAILIDKFDKAASELSYYFSIDQFLGDSSLNHGDTDRMDCNEFIAPMYPECPSFDEFALQVSAWKEDVEERVNKAIADATGNQG